MINIFHVYFKAIIIVYISKEESFPHQLLSGWSTELLNEILHQLLASRALENSSVQSWFFVFLYL